MHNAIKGIVIRECVEGRQEENHVRDMKSVIWDQHVDIRWNGHSQLSVWTCSKQEKNVQMIKNVPLNTSVGIQVNNIQRIPPSNA